MFSTTKSSYLMAYNGDIIMIFTWKIIQLVGGFRYNNIPCVYIYICIYYAYIYIYIPLDNNGPPADLPIWSDPVGPWPTDPAVHQRPAAVAHLGKNRGLEMVGTGLNHPKCGFHHDLPSGNG